jgi:putative transposase
MMLDGVPPLFKGNCACLDAPDPGSAVASAARGVAAHYRPTYNGRVSPGKPTDNAHGESFNGTFRAECLDAHWFTSLSEAKQVIEAWWREYNESRPHRALGERTPNEFAGQVGASPGLATAQAAEDSP